MSPCRSRDAQCCAHCSVGFTGRLRKYCSAECRFAHHAAKYVPVPVSDRACPVCDGSFVGPASMRYCTPACRSARPRPKRAKAGSTKVKAAKRAMRPDVRLSTRVRTAMRKYLARRKGGKSWQTLVGYTGADLMAHLQAQFARGMGWHNMGEWHIDHIKPLVSFDFTSPDCDGFRQAWALSNLRPVWATENLKKGAKFGGRVWRRTPGAGQKSKPVHPRHARPSQKASPQNLGFTQRFHDGPPQAA